MAAKAKRSLASELATKSTVVERPAAAPPKPVGKADTPRTAMTTSVKLPMPVLGALKVLALERGESVNDLLLAAAYNFLELNGRRVEAA